MTVSVGEGLGGWGHRIAQLQNEAAFVMGIGGCGGLQGSCISFKFYVFSRYLDMIYLPIRFILIK